MRAPSFEGTTGYFDTIFEIELPNLLNSFVKGRKDVYLANITRTKVKTL